MPGGGIHALAMSVSNTCSDWSLACPQKQQRSQLDKDGRSPIYGGVLPWQSTNCLLEKGTKAPNVYPSHAPGITNTTSPQQKQSRQPREDRRTPCQLPSNRHPPLSKSSADLSTGRRYGPVESPMSGCLSSARSRSQGMMTEGQWVWTERETSVSQQQTSRSNCSVPMSKSMSNICQRKLLSPVKFPPTHLNQINQHT